jgi:hypothetical protein
MIEKYGKKLIILLVVDVVYFLLWVIPAIKIPNSAAIFIGLALLVHTALAFIENEDDTFAFVTGEEKWFRIAQLVGTILAVVGIVLLLLFI